MTIRSGRRNENTQAIALHWDRIFQHRSDAGDGVSIPEPEERGGLEMPPERPGEPEMGTPAIPPGEDGVA